MRHRPAAAPSHRGGDAGRHGSDQLRRRVDSDASTNQPPIQLGNGAAPRGAHPHPIAGFRGLHGAEIYGDPEYEAYVQDRVGELAGAAFAVQGQRAFESTLRAAALHEAGHCDVYAALGHTVTRRLRVRGRAGHWCGLTTASEPWSCTPATSAAEDADRAVVTIAGVLAEMMFDGGDFRLGSSLDEIALFNALCTNIGIKTGAEIVAVQASTFCGTAKILKSNKPIVLRVAQKLSWHKTLRERELAELLAGVEVAP